MLEAAVAEGICHFDTAPSYADGEARLGKFLQGRDRSPLVISTKVGTEHQTHERSFEPLRMQASLDGSLRRLGIGHVDVLYLHGPSLGDLNTATLDFFEREKAEGRITWSGVNSFDPDVVAALIDSPIDAVMLQYSIADRRFDDLIDRLHDKGKIVIAGTILAQGIFDPRTFIPRNRQSLWYLLRAIKNDPAFALNGWRLSRRIARTGLTANEAAIQFAISHPHITSSLFGTSKLTHLISNAQAANQELRARDLALLAGR